METQISEISIKKHNNKVLTVIGVVDGVKQTSGPTLFTIGDGSGALVLKAFEGPGARAYPEINQDCIIRATIKVKEFQGELEGDVENLVELKGAEAEKAKKYIEEVEQRKAQIKPIPSFMVNSPILEKLKDRYVKAATLIRLSILKSRPIIIRHHNDCDGYSAGYSLEKAIVPLISKHHGGGKSPWEYYTRSPCAAPFYEIEDSIKDAAHSLSDAAKFSNKMPLVIIVDNGSGEEDLIGIQQGKIHGMDFIVVDHHYFEHDLISAEVLEHINPFLVGEDGSKYSAGMLCSELSRFINPEVSVEYIPALSGFADRIDNKEAIEAYVKIAEKKGYTRQLLHDISALVDFVSTKLRFMEAREYIEVLFGDPIDKQKALVKILVPHIRKLEERGITVAKANVKKEQVGKTTLQLLYIEETFSRNTYPKPGKVTGLVHDSIQTEENKTNVVSAGVLTDALTIRATDDSNFSVHDFIAYLNKHVPMAFAQGGGHKHAGALRFVPSKQKDVLQALRDYIKSR